MVHSQKTDLLMTLSNSSKAEFRGVSKRPLMESSPNDDT